MFEEVLVPVGARAPDAKRLFGATGADAQAEGRLDAEPERTGAAPILEAQRGAQIDSGEIRLERLPRGGGDCDSRAADIGGERQGHVLIAPQRVVFEMRGSAGAPFIGQAAVEEPVPVEVGASGEVGAE